MLRSELFTGDPLLEAIAADQDRISRFAHPTDPAVRKLQTALLFWDPECLPQHGADGSYGDETAGAVVRFKVEVLGVPPAQVIDDVGPLTIQRLDAMLPAAGDAPGIDPALREALREILGDPSSPSLGALASELARRGIALTPGELAAVMARLLTA